MDFKGIFEKIDTNSEEKVRAEIKHLVKGDGTFLKLKKLAKRSADNVPDFLDYVYKTYSKKIGSMAKKHDIKFDDMAELFISI